MTQSTSIGGAETQRRESADDHPSGASVTSSGRLLRSGEARYELKGTIGEGGMGRVVEAFDSQFSRVVAVKELHQENADSNARERFALEALITGNLEHAGVPAVYERGVRADGSPYYVMRRVQGRTLAQALAETKTQRERMALIVVVLKAAQTMGFAHAQGVVHRDLKPQNILIGHHGEVFVVDWGLAKPKGAVAHLSSESQSSTGSGKETQFGTVVGTPAYMAPEQARGEVSAIDARTDVFALGAVLYHVLQGRPPFTGATVGQTVTMAARNAPLSFDRSVPYPLRLICERAMSTDQKLRFENAEVFANELERFASDSFLSQITPFSLVANVASALVTLLSVAMLLAVSYFLPKITTLGPPGIVMVLLTLTGLTLSGFEERSKGALFLWPLSLATAAGTFLMGVGAAAGTFGKELEPLTAALAAGRVPVDVVHDAVGVAVTGVVLGSLFAIIQLIIWGMVRRRVLLHER